MELVVEEHIQCATINVGEGLQYLRGALVNAYKQLSWGATSKWKAAQAFNSSQSSLNMLARQYEINNISSLPCVDIPEFKEKVKQCVHKFIEATKAIKSDRGKFVTLTINIFMSTADESRRTQRT